MYDIKYLRKQIDKIDKKLLPLFLKRMDISHKVAEYKRGKGLPVLDKTREEQILEKRTNGLSQKDKAFVREFFSDIMKISRKAQAKDLKKDASSFDIFEGFDKMEPQKNPVVCYQGIPGANSETALINFFGELTEKINVMTFDEVLEKLDDGSADFGIIPIENSSTGSISQAIDLVENHSFYIVGEISVDIQHCLIGKEGTNLKDITTVYSHQQGYMQCREFFQKYPNMTFQPYHNTAMAAKMVAGLGDPSVAAISDPRAAKLYGLSVLANGISSVSSNTTRFVVVAKRGIINEKCNKTSIIFALPNESGTLSDALSVFANYNINLLKIESRPNRDSSFSYIFFADFEGSLLDHWVENALRELNEKSSSFRILGCFPKHQEVKL